MTETPRSEVREQLRQRLLQSQQAVLEVAARLEAGIGGVKVNPHWTAQDLLAHLAAAELGHCEVVRRLRAGQDTTIAGFDLDAYNNAEVEARRHHTLGDLVSEYKANRAATLELLDTIDEGDWDKAGPHPGGFDTTVEGVFRVITIHEKRHLRELQVAL